MTKVADLNNKCLRQRVCQCIQSSNTQYIHEQALGASQIYLSHRAQAPNAYRWLLPMLLCGLVSWGQADENKPFFEEDIPQQKMVMSRRQASKAPEKWVDSQNTERQSNNQVPTHQLNSPGSQLILANSQIASQQNDHKGQAGVSDQHASTPSPQQISSQPPSIQSPVDIIPEQGQTLSSQTPPPIPTHIAKSTPSASKKPDVYAFNRVTQWVNEVSMNMFTFSGEHLHRDRHAASQFFSPEAWETVDKFLFQRANSPFLNMKNRHATSRAMALDWPIAMHTDTSKRGKIWWIKVPVSVMIKEGKARHRAFFEVKLGVLPIKEGKDVQFIAEDVIIQQINTPQRKQARGHRYAG